MELGTVERRAATSGDDSRVRPRLLGLGLGLGLGLASGDDSRVRPRLLGYLRVSVRVRAKQASANPNLDNGDDAGRVAVGRMLALTQLRP